MLGYYAALQVAISPLMVFIAPELDLTHAEAAAHLSAFAVGMILGGVAGGAGARPWSRRVLFWGGSAAMGAGTLGLISASRLSATLACCFVMGLSGTLLLASIQAVLSDLHGPRRAVALTEANVCAILAALLAPLLVGGAPRLGLDPRWGVLPILALGVLTPLLARGAAIPGAVASEATHRPVAGGAFSPRFRTWWAVIVGGVAIEWCLVFWAPSLLESTTRLSPADAALSMSGFFAAMLLGRIAGSRLVRGLDAATLLQGSLVVLTLGTALLWLPLPTVIKLAALALAGLGVANVYPLALSLAVGAEPKRADAASARIVLGVGTSLLLAPLALGGLADALGIVRAFACVPAALPVVLRISVVARRGVRERSPAA